MYHFNNQLHRDTIKESFIFKNQFIQKYYTHKYDSYMKITTKIQVFSPDDVAALVQLSLFRNGGKGSIKFLCSQNVKNIRIAVQHSFRRQYGKEPPCIMLQNLWIELIYSQLSF